MENKVHALKPSFVAQLYSEWVENYQDKIIKEFLIDINQKYRKDLNKYIEPGDTGVFIDDEVLFSLNNPQNTTEKRLWDLESSTIIFEGIQNGFGIYRKDNDNNKIPINTVQATDARLWNYLSLFGLHLYSIERWGESSTSNRIIINSINNGNISRHGISRLYWTAFLSFDSNRKVPLELLQVLWTSTDFMTQVTERSTANMKQQIIWFLEFCKNPENTTKIFKSKSREDERNYRKLLKLFLADSKVHTLSLFSKKETIELLKESLEAC